MPNAQMGDVAFAYDDEDYLLVFDFEAIEYFERHCGSIVAFAEEMAGAGRHPRIAPMVRLLLAGLQRHHPEITGDEALTMLGDPQVQAALGDGFNAAMPDGDGARDADPRKGRSKAGKASTGSRSSRKPAKAGSR